MDGVVITMSMMTMTSTTSKPAKKAASSGRRRHVPQRTCVSCRRVLNKRELHRLVRTPDGVKYDPTGKMAGRGAYLCASRSCWHNALRQGSLARALKTVLTPEEKAMLSELATQLGREDESALTATDGHRSDG